MSDPENPMRMNAAFMRALSPAMRTSAASAMENPPPQAAPCTSAITGCGQRRIRRMMSLKRRCSVSTHHGILDAGDGGLLDVDTCTERAPRPSQHDHAARGILTCRPEVLQEIVHHGL